MAWNNQGSFISPPYFKLWFLKLRSCIRFPFLIHTDFLTPFLYVRNVVMVLSPGGGGGGAWVNICWVCAADITEPLPHLSLFCSHIIDSILVTLGKKSFSQSQLSHLLCMHPEWTDTFRFNLMWSKTFYFWIPTYLRNFLTPQILKCTSLF